MASMSAPALMGPSVAIPGDLTQAGIQQVYQKYLKMKEQGVDETDPEYIKAQQLLQAVSQQSQIRKAQRQQQTDAVNRQRLAQQQQQHQAQAANSLATSNGTSPAHPNVSPAPSAAGGPPPTATDDALAAPNKAAGPTLKPGATTASSLTPEQVAVLRSQIVAYKMLSKNLPIPPAVQQQLFAPTKPKAEDVAGGPDASVEGAVPSTAAQIAPSASPSPSGLRSSINYIDHMRRTLRPVIPSMLPVGIDVEHAREEREKLLNSRVEARIRVLENLPANIATIDVFRNGAQSPDEKLKLKAMLEYKKLYALARQRNLRHRIARDVLHYDNFAQTANRAYYRRSKKITYTDTRLTDKLERQQRDAHESKEKKKQYDQIRAILAHGREIVDMTINQRARATKLGRLMLGHHTQIEKDEQKRIERTAKQRLQALKNDDEATYLKLLGQAKDSRITHLLKQTDGFLGQLADSVKEQQRSAAERYGADELPMEDGSGSEDEEGGPKVDYYQVAHRIKEEVKEQAKILVGGTLKEYQIKGLQWMISLYNNNLNGILADEMGLGKTIQTISLITYLIEKKRQDGPYLVIVPLSTLTNWSMEFDKWAPSVSVIIYKGPPNSRKMQQAQIRTGRFQVLLTTYEYIIKDRPILSKIKWLHMIVDEGHRMKNANSKLSSTITQYYSTRFRLILTGTPLQNNLPELWALLNFSLPTIFKSVKSFDEWFNTPFANTGVSDRMELTEEEQLLIIRRLHKVLRPFLLRRLKKDVEKELPDKQERVIKCKFSALQAKLYKQLVTNQQISVSDGKGGKTGIRGLSNMLMQLRKLCNHPFVFEQVEDVMNPSRLTNDLIWRTAGKFELLDRILPKFKATGHRVLMFFQMTQIMTIMEDFLQLRGIQYLRLDGATKSDDRSELLKIFNAPDSPYFCFLLSTRAGGLGLNLQTADTVIIYDSDWNPFQDLQAQDRAHRIGQKNEVRIFRLISSNSVEEKILERARFKLDMDGKVIQAGKFDNKSTNEERENLLRTLMDAAENAEAFGDQEEMDNEDLNIQMARSEEELSFFQELDAERAADPVYGTGKALPRLMAENELPDIYLNDDVPAQAEAEEFVGRGARERTRVKYDDGLTEEQWLNAVDDDEDTIEAAVARKNARIEKRLANKEKRSRLASAPESSPEPPAHQTSEEPEPVAAPPKKRNRKSNGAKRKAEEEVEEPAAAPKKKPRGRAGKANDTLSPADRGKLQKILNIVYQHISDLEEEMSAEGSDDEEGPVVRPIIDPFVKLVPKSQYPDYYMIIANPIAMENIQKKINKYEYQSPRQFMNDVRLLCTNARTYNEDGSLLFQDALRIEAAALEKLRSEIGDKAEWQNLEPGSDAAAGGSADASGTGTPARPTSASAPKLRLTFNSGSASNAASVSTAAGLPATATNGTSVRSDMEEGESDDE